MVSDGIDSTVTALTLLVSNHDCGNPQRFSSSCENYRGTVTLKTADKQKQEHKKLFISCTKNAQQNVKSDQQNDKS